MCIFSCLTLPARLRISTVPHIRRQNTAVRLLLQRHRCKCRTQYDGNSAYPRILRELFFYLFHIERNHGFVTGSCTSNVVTCENIKKDLTHMAQSLLIYESALCSQARCMFPP